MHYVCTYVVPRDVMPAGIPVSAHGGGRGGRGLFDVRRPRLPPTSRAGTKGPWRTARRIRAISILLDNAHFLVRRCKPSLRWWTGEKRREKSEITLTLRQKVDTYVGSWEVSQLVKPG